MAPPLPDEKDLAPSGTAQQSRLGHIPSTSSTASSTDTTRVSEEHDAGEHDDPDLAEVTQQRSRRSQLSRAFSRTTSLHDDKIILTFDDDDPDDPYNWPLGKKYYVVLAGIVATLNSTLGSSMPSGAINELSRYFNVTNQEQLVLPISLYLVGYVLAPVFFGPLSETYGRRHVMLFTFVLFTLFTMASALAPNWPAFLIFRLICGVNASSPIAVTGGLYADIFRDPISRGRGMAVFMATTAVGPTISPVISGYVSVVSWRWAFWISLIFAGVSLIFIFFLPETYGPTILARRARRIRREGRKTSSATDFIEKPPETDRVYAAIELESTSFKQLVTVILMRPIHMIIFESIVLLTCLYLALAYAIFYLFFEAYPIIFQQLYGLSAGRAGLAFLPILGGVTIALGVFFYWDGVLQRARHRRRPWANVEEYRRLPLACLGGPAYILALFWLGWTSRPSIPAVVPMLAGIPFGLGFVLIFMALLNYLTDAYQVYAASAMAAGSLSRSVFGATLPLAAKPMYARLGIAWASSLLGFLSLAMCIIPFAFIRYGTRIRAGSTFCQELKLKREREDRDRQRRAAKTRARAAAAAAETAPNNNDNAIAQSAFEGVDVEGGKQSTLAHAEGEEATATATREKGNFGAEATDTVVQ